MTIQKKYGKVCINKISGYWCLDYLYINEEYRGQGYAHELMQDALKKCQSRPIFLFATSEFGSNYNRLIKFYKQFGFVPEKQAKDSAVPFNFNMVLWE